MKEATLIFPHQLFADHPGLSRNRKIYLVEHPIFVQREGIRHHKKKILLHRASVKACFDRLEHAGYSVEPIIKKEEADLTHLFERLKLEGFDRVHYADVTDSKLEQELRNAQTETKIPAMAHPTPCFLSPKDWLVSFFDKTTHFSQVKFYIAQRKRLGILVEAGKPIDGKWSFDPQNRKRIPKSFALPDLRIFPENKYISEAATHVVRNFSAHPGEAKGFHYPIDHHQALSWLDDFLEKRFERFGEYEDAMVMDEPFLFHSVLTPTLNIGLLTPKQVLDRVLEYAASHSIPINSVEGFIRQIIGWREFMRAVYLIAENRERTTNFWKHTHRIPKSFYEGETGILPVDTVIKRIKQHAYAHHIERLMVLGNFMMLCEIHPDEVYRWFMEMFIDSYDWVMVPNVYGMSQHADGGLITTKPYISASSYIRRMSDFPKGDWCDVWDGLFWRFIDEHKDFFASNPRMKMMAVQADRMDQTRLKKHKRTADAFLDRLLD